MNEFLFSGVIKNLDYFLIVDSPERIQLSWLKGLREQTSLWAKDGVNGVYMDRIYLARYFDDMTFFGGIHWGLANVRQKIIQLPLKTNCIRVSASLQILLLLWRSGANADYVYPVWRKNLCLSFEFKDAI
jgi:hypothetical protein